MELGLSLAISCKKLLLFQFKCLNPILLPFFYRMGWWLDKVRIRLTNGTGAEPDNNMRYFCEDDINPLILHELVHDIIKY